MPKFQKKTEGNRPIIYPVVFRNSKHFEKISKSSLFENFQLYRCKALIDTGATHSTITPEKAHELDLEPYKKSEVRSASHSVTTNAYTITIFYALLFSFFLHLIFEFVVSFFFPVALDA